MRSYGHGRFRLCLWPAPSYFLCSSRTNFFFLFLFIFLLIYPLSFYLPRGFYDLCGIYNALLHNHKKTGNLEEISLSHCAAMAKNIEDPYVASALNSLLSEAHSSLPKANKESHKRPASQDIPYATTKSSHSKSDESINSHSTSASGSTISLRDNIRYNRYSVNNAGIF